MKYKPRLFHDVDGNLFVQIGSGTFTETRKVPYFELPRDFYDWLDEVVPQMCSKLTGLRREKTKKLVQKDKRDESKKRSRNTSRSHLRSV